MVKIINAKILKTDKSDKLHYYTAWYHKMRTAHLDEIFSAQME